MNLDSYTIAVFTGQLSKLPRKQHTLLECDLCHPRTGI